ncbi:MAG: STM4015 family protein [Vallitalea sp.]|nr:STM4015 family protein [Vallitalea sp.]
MKKDEIKFYLTWEEEEEEEITVVTKIQDYLNDYGKYENEKLIIGMWIGAYENSPNHIVEFLVKNAEQFPNLKEIYFGDMEGEECEISWINNTDLAPLINTFKVEKFTAKGGEGLRFNNIKSESLKSLSIISGGTDKETLNDLINAQLPNLERIEIYLGVSAYGFNAEIEDITPFIKRENFPKLKYLGLKNSEIQDEICEKVFEGDILKDLRALDLSLGTLGDKGAKVILDNIEKLSHLECFDLTYNYISENPLNEIGSKLKEYNVKFLSSQEDVYIDKDDEWRYPYITE